MYQSTGDNNYLSLPPTVVLFQNRRAWKRCVGKRLIDVGCLCLS